jgi:hypothetical protein
MRSPPGRHVRQGGHAPLRESPRRADAHPCISAAAATHDVILGAWPEDPALGELRWLEPGGVVATSNNPTECAEPWVLGTSPRMTSCVAAVVQNPLTLSRAPRARIFTGSEAGIQHKECRRLRIDMVSSTSLVLDPRRGLALLARSRMTEPFFGAGTLGRVDI